MVKIRFLKPAKPTQFEYIIGMYIGDDVHATGIDAEGFPIVTRGHVLWDGAIFSTPLDQMEVCGEKR
jgi:hypothetical protein